MISDRGFIILDRAIFDHPFFQGKFNDGWAFAWMLAHAAWKPRRVYVSGRWVDLERGQFCHSVRYMANKFKWSIKKVRCFIDRLTKDRMLRTGSENAVGVENGGLEKGTARGTVGNFVVSVITICNYEHYQSFTLDKEIEKGKERGTGGAQEGHKVNQVTNKQEERGDGIREAENVSQNVSQPDFKKLAWDLNVKLWIIMGIDPGFPDPGWCGLAHALEAGLRGNKWDPEICRLAAVKLAAKKRPKSFKYLLDAIHTEHQETADILKRMESANVVQPNQRELALLAPINGGFARKGGGFAAVGQKAFKAGGRP